MKFYVLLVLTSIALCCKSKRDEGSPATEMLKDPEVSILKADPNQDLQKSKTALPGIDFGISLKEYQASNKYMMQGLGSNTYFVKPLFNSQSQLFKIELAGLSRNASYSEAKLRDDHNNLIRFFEIDNGKPKILTADPKLADIRSGEIKWTHSWSNHSKRIKVGIAEGTTGETYEVVGWIYDKSMLEKKLLADSLMLQPETKGLHKSKKRSKRSRKARHDKTVS